MIVGIDLALRNTGIVVLDKDGNYVSCKMISSDSKKLNGEALLEYNCSEVGWFIWNHYLNKKQFGAVALIESYKVEPTHVGMEGLSFNSKSSSVDLIAANHWFVRAKVKKVLYPLNLKSTMTIIPPKSWMKAIVTKDVLAGWAEKHPVTRAKRGMKLTKEEKSANARSKAQVRKLSKQLVLDTVPEDVRTQLQKYVKDNKLPADTIYDLSDAYHIARYTYSLGSK